MSGFRLSDVVALTPLKSNERRCLSSASSRSLIIIIDISMRSEIYGTRKFGELPELQIYALFLIAISFVR